MPDQLIKYRIPTRRDLLILLIHALAFGFAYAVSFGLRFEFHVPASYQKLFWQTVPAVIVLKVVLFYSLGHWRFSWRHPTFSDLAALLRASTLATLVIATVDVMVKSYNIPRSIVCFDWAMTIITLGGLRALWRLSREEFRALVVSKDARKALIVGANPSGELLARQLLHDNRFKYLAVGFVDDDMKKQGTRLVGVRVRGVTSDAAKVAVELGATEMLVISGVLTGERLRQLIEECKQANLNVKVIPAMDDLLSGDYTVQIRDVDINDLLRREPIQLSDEVIRKRVENNIVMVTGAGGSIGSEICRQVLKYQPRRLILVERAENSLFEIDREFQELDLEVEICPALADITDRNRMEQVFSEHHPELVFHAAAHKHVPLMEFNPGEAVKNNVLGTMMVAELAEEYGAHEFVLISTDKSVNPTSVMGASKQLAERFVHAYSKTGATKFVAVRFGNVLASAGSVVPIFKDQIRQGGPITVTHPDIERFFMTIPEASQLVLQAAAMGKGGEIFVLDMGKPVKIVDLAQDLIRLSRLSPDDIPIVFTGLRPGEKLYEELYLDDEETLPTPHPKLHVAYHRPFEIDEVRRSIARLETALQGSPEAIRSALKELIPEYLPSEPLCDSSDQAEHVQPTTDPQVL